MLDPELCTSIKPVITPLNSYQLPAATFFSFLLSIFSRQEISHATLTQILTESDQEKYEKSIDNKYLKFD